MVQSAYASCWYVLSLPHDSNRIREAEADSSNYPIGLFQSSDSAAKTQPIKEKIPFCLPGAVDIIASKRDEPV